MGNPYLTMRIPSGVKILFLLSLAFCIIFGDILSAEADSFHMRIGFSSRAFVNVPREDIKIAVQVLSQKVAKKTVGSAESRIYANSAEIEKDLKSKLVDVVALTPEEFIHLKARYPLEPLMVTVAGKSHEVELLVLARKESGLSRIKELKNRSIALPFETSQFGSIYHMWLETLAMKEGAWSAAGLFSSIKETRGASQALMSVFFHKTDACIITRSAFEISSELNPQLSRELKVIANIGRLAGGIVAFRQDFPEERKQKVRQALLTLHDDQDGKQMFVLFQLSRLEEYRPEYLQATEALFAEYRNLKARMTRR
jgi:ABC-type phosphate/phosphonate transport system substrate-binding protein